MPKKKKAAGGPPPEPASPINQPTEEVDFEPPTSPSTSDGEGRSTSQHANSNNKRDASPSLRADRESPPRSSSSSSSSSEEATQPDNYFGPLTPGALALLLWEEETKANIRAIRENRPQVPLSAASAAVALSISRHEAAAVHEAAMVSEIGPVLPTPTTSEDISMSSSTPPADVSVPASSSCSPLRATS